MDASLFPDMGGEPGRQAPAIPPRPARSAYLLFGATRRASCPAAPPVWVART